LDQLAHRFLSEGGGERTRACLLARARIETSLYRSIIASSCPQQHGGDAAASSHQINIARLVRIFFASRPLNKRIIAHAYLQWAKHRVRMDIAKATLAWLRRGGGRSSPQRDNGHIDATRVSLLFPHAAVSRRKQTRRATTAGGVAHPRANRPHE